MATVIVILVLLSTVAFFYLKCPIMQSLTTLWSAVLATIVSFNYYESVAELLISRGYGLQWAHAGCFVILFIVVFVLLRSLVEYLITASVDLGQTPKLIIALACGVLTGLIFSGNLLVALGLLPMHGKLFYSRYAYDKPVVLNSPKTPALGTDGFTAGLFSHISSGSMSSKQSFGVFHADYLTQIHLNKLRTKIKEGQKSQSSQGDQGRTAQTPVLAVCSSEALVLPRDKEQKPVRWEMVEDKEVMIVRAGVQAKKIADGGANNTSGKINFFPGQIRLIAKESNSNRAGSAMAGKAVPFYPIGFWKNGVTTSSDLNEIKTPNAEEIKDRIYWMDVIFECPKDNTPVLLQFKQNAVVDLTPHQVVKNTPEIEQVLDSEGQKEETL